MTTAMWDCKLLLLNLEEKTMTAKHHSFFESAPCGRSDSSIFHSQAMTDEEYADIHANFERCEIPSVPEHMFIDDFPYAEESLNRSPQDHPLVQNISNDNLATDQPNDTTEQKIPKKDEPPKIESGELTPAQKLAEFLKKEGLIVSENGDVTQLQSIQQEPQSSLQAKPQETALHQAPSELPDAKTPKFTKNPSADLPAKASSKSSEVAVLNNTESSTTTPNSNQSLKASKSSVYHAKYVVQQNTLLEAMKHLDLYERRLLIYLSPHVRLAVEKDPSQDTFLVDIKHFSLTFGLDKNKNINHFMRKSGQNMQRKFFSIIKEFDGYLDEIDVNYAFRFRYREQSSQMWVSLSSELIEMLTVFDAQHPFTKYELTDVIKMKSQASITLFELLTQHKKMGKRQFSVAYLRKILLCEDKYEAEHDFVRYIIKKSVNDINKFTGLNVEIVITKKDRKPFEIEFIIKDVRSEKQKLNKELAKVDFGYTTSHEIVNHNLNKVLGLNISQLRRVVSRKQFVHDYPPAANSGMNSSDLREYYQFMIDKLLTDCSFVNKHTLDYYLELSENAS